MIYQSCYNQWIRSLCVIKKLTLGNEPTKNYSKTLQFPSAMYSFVASLSSLFGFLASKIYCFGSVIFGYRRQLLSLTKAKINTVYATCPAPRDS